VADAVADAVVTAALPPLKRALDVATRAAMLGYYLRVPRYLSQSAHAARVTRLNLSSTLCKAAAAVRGERRLRHSERLGLSAS